MNVYLAKFFMYYEVHRMHLEGHSMAQISDYLVLNRRTVSRYLSMSEKEYESFINKQSDRKKILLPYENFIKDRLEQYQETPAAQMHDWLKEYYPGFPVVSQKTVFNFVHWVRNKYNIPKVKPPRQYHPVEEMPYGKQGQVDFGQYNMRASTGKRVKVFFFTFVLSRSRYKFIWFIEQNFTSELAIKGHELAFGHIMGVPDEIVYDQDKVFITSENGGDIILTDAFKAYTRGQSFTLHFCRKSDPESKGKIENVVKYVKQNFLYNRTYYNIETLNDEVLGWMGRTANLLPHSFTQKIPHSEWIIEQDFLKPYIVHITKPSPFSSVYTVRIDNSIKYKGNLYSLPLGTYQGRGSEVRLQVEGDLLIVLDDQGQRELCRHRLGIGRGQKIFNSDHKRDKSSAISEMIEQLASQMPDPQKARDWFALIKKEKPRYIRDQLLIIRETVKTIDLELTARVLQYCLDNKITSAMDSKAIAAHYIHQQEDKGTTKGKIVPLNPLSGKFPGAAYRKPDKSSLDDYLSIINDK